VKFDNDSSYPQDPSTPSSTSSSSFRVHSSGSYESKNDTSQTLSFFERVQRYNGFVFTNRMLQIEEDIKKILPDSHEGFDRTAYVYKGFRVTNDGQFEAFKPRVGDL
jgi:hypothetical protein